MTNLKKNDEFEVTIEDYGMSGEGIAKVDGFTIFVPGALKDEKVKIALTKVTTNFAFARIVKIEKESKYRREPDCLSYKRCGGCNMRHIDYEETLKIKKANVENLVKKTFGDGTKIKVKDAIGMKSPYNYRNKAQYPVGYDKNGEPDIGVYAERTHDIVHCEDCRIQNELSEKIASSIFKFSIENGISFYDEKTRKGLLRHIVIKIGFKTREIMVVLVVNGNKLPYTDELTEMLVKTFNVKTVLINVNREDTNVILGHQNINLHGDGYIYDILGDYTFKISAKSFYQVNSEQAEVLYNEALKMTKPDKDDILFDLYCGIGTIGIFASTKVKKVYGIEIVSDAIKDAEDNAKENNIKNIEFIEGDVEKTFNKLLEDKGIYPDIIVVDPPRKGLDENTINNILAVEPKKITYISCNPATLVRDMELLSEKYDADEILPVDMFPYTSACECVTVLKLRK